MIRISSLLLIAFLCATTLNAGILPEDSGAYNIHNLKVGTWKEYRLDTAHTAAVLNRDLLRRFCADTCEHLIVMNTGKYLNGSKDGVWKTYYRYSASSSKWDYAQSITYANGFLDGKWNYYSALGKVLFQYEFKMNKRNGTWTEYYADGKQKSVLHFLNDWLNGKQTYYHENGKVARMDHYTNGYINGVSKMYYRNGKIRLSREYKNGIIWNETVHKSVTGRDLDIGTLKDGIGMLNLYNEAGGLITSITYRYGHKEGKVVTYYSSGGIETTGYNVSDSLDGTYKTYYEDGRLSVEAVVRRGKYDGLYRFYFPNGKEWGAYRYKKGKFVGVEFINDTNGKALPYGDFVNGNGLLYTFNEHCVRISSSVYKDGKKNGEHYSYFPTGVVHYHYFEVDGVAQGEDTLFYENGNPRRSGNVTDGEWDGLIRSYYYNGHLKNVERFRKGLFIELVESYDLKGNRINAGNVAGGEGTFTNYSDTTEMYAVYGYKYGRLSGTYTKYYKPGQVRRTATYVNDTLVGADIFYFPDGKKEYETNLYKGMSDGIVSVYHSNGKIWSQRVYYGGYMLEIKNNFDANGMPVEKGTLKDGNGTVYEYDEDGKLLAIHEVVNGFSQPWVRQVTE